MTGLYAKTAAYERCQPTPSNPFNLLITETSMAGESSGTDFGARVFKCCINIITVVVIFLCVLDYRRVKEVF
jgi:hypothetical protein